MIGFENDSRTFTIPIDIIKSYPNSLIYGYCANIDFDLSEKIILDLDNPGGITYESFKLVYDVITGATNQFETSPDTMVILDYYGFVNDILLRTQKYLDMKKNQKLCRINNFIKGIDKLFVPKNSKDYLHFKEIFRSQSNIIPIQFICCYTTLIGINIYSGIPIYYTGYQNSKKSPYLKDHDGIPENETNINYLKYQMFFTNYKDPMVEHALQNYSQYKDIYVADDEIRNALSVTNLLSREGLVGHYPLNEHFVPEKIINRMNIIPLADTIMNIINPRLYDKYDKYNTGNCIDFGQEPYTRNSARGILCVHLGFINICE